jgi:hypothetical protein
MAQKSDTLAPIPSGWAACAEKKETVRDSEPVVIEIGKCRVAVTVDADEDLLEKVCRTLTALC